MEKLDLYDILRSNAALKVSNNPAFTFFAFLKYSENSIIKKRSNIFSVDRGINHKQNGKLLQQGASGIDKVFCPFGLISRSTKNIFNTFLKSFCTTDN